MANPQQQQQWLDLFNDPDPAKLAQLGPQFKDFVRYVFERAGYTVEPYTNPGADFELLNEGRKLGYLAVSGAAQYNVGAGPVLALNGIQTLRGTERFLVTQNDFTPQAYDEVPQMKEVRLINGQKLRRYISYIRGTRHPKSRGAPISPAALFDNEPSKRPKTQTKVLTFANNKGGVCKTTSALAFALLLAAEHNKRVLLIDLDDQANLTQGALGSTRYIEPNISDYFVGVSPLPALVRPSRYNNIWIIPSHPDLRLTLSHHVDWLETEQLFTDGVHHPSLVIPQTGENFDWIIIDTPPSLSLYTRAALLAAHYVLAPFTPSLFDQAGLINLLETLNDINCITNAGDQTQVLGCFATRWKRGVAIREGLSTMQQIAISANAPLFDPVIGDDTNNVSKLLREKTAVNITKEHGVFDDYRDLLREVRNNVGDN